MNNKRLAEIIKDPGIATEKEVKQIKAYSREYSYSPFLKVLQARLDHLHNAKDKSGSLTKAAIYIADRSILKDFITSDKLSTVSSEDPPVQVKPKKERKSEKSAVEIDAKDKDSKDKDSKDKDSKDKDAKDKSAKEDFTKEDFAKEDVAKEDVAEIDESVTPGQEIEEEIIAAEQEDITTDQAKEQEPVTGDEKKDQEEIKTDSATETETVTEHPAHGKEEVVAEPEEKEAITPEEPEDKKDIKSEKPEEKQETKTEVPEIKQDIKPEEPEVKQETKTEEPEIKQESKPEEPEPLDEIDKRIQASEESDKSTSLSKEIMENISELKKHKASLLNLLDNDTSEDRDAAGSKPEKSSKKEKSKKKEEHKNKKKDLSGKARKPEEVDPKSSGSAKDSENEKYPDYEEEDPVVIKDFLTRLEESNPPPKKKLKKEEQEQLIEKFIQSDPQMQNVRSSKELTEKKDLSAPSVKFRDDIISENLACIMIKQGKHEKAIDIYKKLIWKFPQKKAYFATQIEELKKKLKK